MIPQKWPCLRSIDNFLMRELKDVPRSYIYRILRKGEVRVNKKRAKPTLKLIENDIRVSLGTDGAASNNTLDMFETVKTAALIHKPIRRDKLSASLH